MSHSVGWVGTERKIKSTTRGFDGAFKDLAKSVLV